MNNQIRSLKFNAFVNGLRTILNLIFPLITFPYISRVLSVDEIGKYNFSDSIVSYFLLFAALGISQYAVREGTKFRDSRKDISTFASKAFSVNVSSTVLSYIALVILLACSGKLSEYRVCIGILSTQIFFTTLGTEWIYSIYEEYTYITVRSIVFKIISIILLFVFVRNEGDYLKYAAITVIASVGSNILNYFNAKKYCDIRFTWKFDWKSVLKPVLVIFASNIAIQIYVNSDITMLGYLASDYAVGIYSISTKIYTIVKNVLSAVLIVTIPRFSLYAGRLKDEYNELLQKVINTLIVIIIPAIPGLILLSRNAILIIAGENYGDSQASLCILSISLLFAVINGMFSQCVLLPFKREKVFLKCTTISAVVNVVLNFFLIPVLLEVGAALTTLIAELILCIMLYVESRDIVGEILKSANTKKNAFSVLVSTVCMSATCVFIMRTVGSFYLQTVFAIAGAVAIYGIALIVMKNEVLISNLKAVVGKIKR